MDPDETSYQQGTSAGEDDDITSFSSSHDKSYERTIEPSSNFTTITSQSSDPHIHTEGSESSSHDETKKPLPSFASLKPQQTTSHTGDPEDSESSSHDETKKPLPSFTSLKPQQTTSHSGDTEDSESSSHDETKEPLPSFASRKPQQTTSHTGDTEDSESSSHDETKKPLPSFASLKPQQTTSHTGDTEDSDLSGRDEFRERVAESFLGLVLPASNLSTRYVHPTSSDFVSNISTPKLESEPLPSFETLSTSAIHARIAYLSSITPISESMSRVPWYVSRPSSSNVVYKGSSDFSSHHVPRKRALELLYTRSPHIMTQPSTSNVVMPCSEFKSKKFRELPPKSLPSLEVLTTLLSTSHVDTTSNESNKLSSEQSLAATTHMFPSTSNVDVTRNSDFSSRHKPNVCAAQSSTTMTFCVSQPSTFNVDTVVSECLNRHRVLASESLSYVSQASTSNIDIGSSDSSVRPEPEVSGSEPVTDVTSYTSQSSKPMSKVVNTGSRDSSEPESEITSYTSQPSASKVFNIGSSDFPSRRGSPNLASAQFTRYSSLLSRSGTSREGTHEFSQNLPELTDKDLRELDILNIPIQMEERTFQCDSCPRKFYSQDTLTIHKCDHSAKRIFTCSICKAVFHHPVNYANHYASHTEQNKHLCDICGRMFDDEYLLIRHIRRHSDDGE